MTDTRRDDADPADAFAVLHAYYGRFGDEADFDCTVFPPETNKQLMQMALRRGRP